MASRRERHLSFMNPGAAPMNMRLAVKSRWLFACTLGTACCLEATDSKSDKSDNAATSAVDAMRGQKAGQIRDDNCLTMKLVWCPPVYPYLHTPSVCSPCS